MRRAGRLALAFVAIGALAAAIAWGVGQLSLEGKKTIIGRELSAALGREVSLGGEFRLALLPRPALEVSDVTVASPAGGSTPYLIRIEELRLALALWPLLRKRLHLVELRIDGADIRLESGTGGADALTPIARLSGDGSEPERPIAVRVDRIELQDARLSWLDAKAAKHVTLDVDSLEIGAEDDRGPIEWSVQGSLRGGSFGFAGRGGTLAELLHPSGPWPLSLEGHAGEATVRLQGQIEHPTRFEGLDLDLEIALPDVGALLSAESSRPGLGRAKLRGHLVDPAGETGLDQLVVESDPDAELRLRAQGAVRRLADPSGIELEGQIEADRLRCLELLVGRPLPEGKLQAKFRLSDRDGTIGVDGEARAESSDGSFRAELSGGFDDLRARDALDARLRIAAPALDALGRAAGLAWELPPVGPVTLGARLRARAGSVGVDELDLDAGRRDQSWLSLRGSVRDLAKLRGVALTASSRVQSLASLEHLLRIPRALPELGPLELRATLGDARGPLGVGRFELRGGTPATLAVDVTGSVADVREPGTLDLEGSLQARDAALLGTLFGVELPPVAPVGFDGRLRGSAGLLESEGTASLGQTRIEGRWSAQLAGAGRPRVTAKLSSTHLHLEDLGLAAASTSEARSPGAWRGSERLPFEQLRRLDARLELQADQVSSRGSVYLRDARAALELEDGDLHVRQAELEYQGGRIAGELRIDARTPDPRVTLRADATALDLARLGPALGRPEDAGSGLLDLVLDLRSGGTSADALREGLEGRVAFAARDWSGASLLARRFIVDLSHAFLPSLRRPPGPAACFLGALEFTEGVGAVETLVLAGERATVVGAGSVDLAREEWHLELVPGIHDPGLLEVAAAVRVTGPLDAPRFKPVPLDLVAGTLRDAVRKALWPARAVTAGTERLLGPLAGILSPLRAGLDLAEGKDAMDALPCRLPAPP